jgi:hypothetical protein
VVGESAGSRQARRVTVYVRVVGSDEASQGYVVDG